MSDFKSRYWYYNEWQHVGIDFESLEEVKSYDDEIGKGMNLHKNLKELVETIELKPTDSVLEIGTATGNLAIYLSKLCKQVYAIDISEPMLEYAKEKAENHRCNNVEFIKAGFLTYQHEKNPLDAVITEFALHHMPDHWKFVALKRIFDMLKPGGKFYLRDVILSIDVREFFDSMDYWVSETRKSSGNKAAEALALNIKEEYPTYSWVITGMLEKIGFNINTETNLYGLHTIFVCSKPL